MTVVAVVRHVQLGTNYSCLSVCRFLRKSKSRKLYLENEGENKSKHLFTFIVGD